MFMCTPRLICCTFCYPEPTTCHKRCQRLYRNMIGEPMNFFHNAHVGTREMSRNSSSVSTHSWISRNLGSVAC
uniref:CRIB domain-containing protein n=1 Tax=Anser brachyrhynchus TaxID=132585 RepID=A0A8B9I3W1_9AVES